MQLFRGPGVSAEPIPVAGPRFGPRSARRYGRLRVTAPGIATGIQAQPVAPAPEEELFPWVDQEFEEYFYE